MKLFKVLHGFGCRVSCSEASRLAEFQSYYINSRLRMVYIVISLCTLNLKTVEKLTTHSSSPVELVNTLITDIIDVIVPTMPPTTPNKMINIFFAKWRPDPFLDTNESIIGGNTEKYRVKNHIIIACEIPKARRDEAQAPIRAIKSPRSGIAIASEHVNKTRKSFRKNTLQNPQSRFSMITAMGIKNCNPYDTKIANMYISFTDMYKVS